MASSMNFSHTGGCRECGKILAFNMSSPVIECPCCSYRHDPTGLTNIERFGESFLSLYKLVRKELTASTKDSKPTQIQGITSYECKLLGPHLTTHGMDKAGNPKRLQDLPKPKEYFDAAILGDRSFTIERQHLSAVGYGTDKYSLKYLSEILSFVDEANKKERCLVPLHVDGDGHCLVHAISRCLVGRELFWHALRTNVYHHMRNNKDRYEKAYGDFFDSNEWDRSVEEAHPDYRPPADSLEGHGLCVIHIFALSNVLRRPILLLDGMEGLQSKCEYTGIYLPSLCAADECRDSRGQPNRPIAVAWGSAGHNHYVPLVPVEGTPLVKFPARLLPKVSISQQEDLKRYVQLEEDGSIVLGGEKCLPDSFIIKLAGAMRHLFYEKHLVTSTLVADAYYSVFRATGAVHIELSGVLELVLATAKDDRLYRCLSCSALTIEELVLDLKDADLLPGGLLHEYSDQSGLQPRDGLVYSFPTLNVRARYETATRKFHPTARDVVECSACGQRLVRRQSADGRVHYEHGDRTLTPATKSKNCSCGFKHFFNGKEYDNLPLKFPLMLSWNESRVEVEVYWHENEEDPSLNSNAYSVASVLVNKNFPAEFGSESLLRRVVEQIFKKLDARDKLTKVREIEEQPSVASTDPMHESVPIKTIMTGHSRKTFHKEELGVSQKERELTQRIAKNAANQQSKATASKASGSSPGKQPGVPRTSSSSGLAASSSTATPTSSTARAAATAAAADVASASGDSASTAEDAGESPKVLVKVRVSMQGGKFADLEFVPPIMPDDLQLAIREHLGVPQRRQRLRYGFPPRELKFVDGEEVPLKRGDKLTLEDAWPQQPTTSGGSASKGLSTGAPVSRGTASSSLLASSATPLLPTLDPPTLLPRPGTMATSGSASSTAAAMSALAEARNLSSLAYQDPAISSEVVKLLMGYSTDLFSEYRQRPLDFEGDGVVMQWARSCFASMYDGMHIQLPFLHNKNFRYNKAADRLELCLGAHHKPVADVTHTDVITAEQVAQGLIPESDMHAGSGVSSPTGGGTGRISAGGSGVVSSGQIERSAAAFTGQGHKMNAETPWTVGSASSDLFGLAQAAAAQASMGSVSSSSGSGSSSGGSSSLTAAARRSLQTAAPSGHARHHPHPPSPPPPSSWPPEDNMDDSGREKEGNVSSDDTLCSTEGSEGEELVYKGEKPKKRPCKPSTLVLHALEQRHKQLQDELAVLEAELRQFQETGSQDGDSRTRKHQLKSQLDDVQEEIERVATQLRTDTDTSQEVTTESA